MTPKTDDLVKLLPCPFCGGEATVQDEILSGGYMVIGCREFGCAGHRSIDAADDEDAMNTGFEKWNLRTQPPQDGGLPIATAPMDGTAFYARFKTPMRWLPYKKGYTGPEKGRWQEMNEYGGWDNTDLVPEDWQPHTQPAKTEGEGS